MFWTVSDFEGFPGKFIFENVGNKSTKDWAELMTFNARSLNEL